MPNGKPTLVLGQRVRWVVESPPVGRYRSFDRRGWPHAVVAMRDPFDKTGVRLDDVPIARIECEDEYVPRRVKAGDHKPLRLAVRFGVPREQWPSKGRFVWRRLTRTAATLTEAKAILTAFIITHPDHDWGIAE